MKIFLRGLAVGAAVLMGVSAFAQAQTPAKAPSAAAQDLDKIWNEFSRSAEAAAVAGSDELRIKSRLQAAFAAFMEEEVKKVVDAEKRAADAEKKVADLQHQLAGRQSPAAKMSPAPVHH